MNPSALFSHGFVYTVLTFFISSVDKLLILDIRIKTGYFNLEVNMKCYFQTILLL